MRAAPGQLPCFSSRTLLGAWPAWSWHPWPQEGVAPQGTLAPAELFACQLAPSTRWGPQSTSMDSTRPGAWPTWSACDIAKAGAPTHVEGRRTACQVESSEPSAKDAAPTSKHASNGAGQNASIEEVAPNESRALQTPAPRPTAHPEGRRSTVGGMHSRTKRVASESSPLSVCATGGITLGLCTLAGPALSLLTQ